MDLEPFWNSALAGTATLIMSYIGTRTEAFKKWSAKRKAARAEKKAMPAMLTKVAGQVLTLFDNDTRRTEQLDALAEKIVVNTGILAAQNVALGDIASMAYGQMEQDPVPRFVCDNDGSNRLVNTAYARMVGCGRDELTKFNYLRFFPTMLNPQLMANFQSSASRHHTFEAEAVVERPNGTMFMVHIRCVPHPEDAPPATHWNGTVRFLREYAEP